MTLLFKLRLALYTITLILVSFLAVLEGVVLTLVGKRLNTNYYVARTFLHTAGPLMGWKFEIEGEEHLWSLGKSVGAEGVVGSVSSGGRSAVMLGNHQSFVDILYLGRVFPKHAAIMAKKSIKWIPGLGWFMMLAGTVFIDRGNNKSAVASMTQAGDDMKRKRISLWIFPEGTRHLSRVNDLLPFKKGAFYLAVQSGIPIVPVVCQNYHHLFDGKTRFKSGTLRIKVLPPIPTTGMTSADVPALIEKTHSLMVKTLQEISHPSYDPSAPTPLLQGQSSTNYETISSTDPLSGAVAGSSGADGRSITPQSSVSDDAPQSPLLAKTDGSTNAGDKKKKGVKKSIA